MFAKHPRDSPNPHPLLYPRKEQNPTTNGTQHPLWIGSPGTRVGQKQPRLPTRRRTAPETARANRRAGTRLVLTGPPPPPPTFLAAWAPSHATLRHPRTAARRPAQPTNPLDSRPITPQQKHGNEKTIGASGGKSAAGLRQHRSNGATGHGPNPASTKPTKKQSTESVLKRKHPQQARQANPNCLVPPFPALLGSLDTEERGPFPFFRDLLGPGTLLSCQGVPKRPFPNGEPPKPNPNAHTTAAQSKPRFVSFPGAAPEH